MNKYLQIGMGYSLMLNDDAIEILVNVSEQDAKRRLDALRSKHLQEFRASSPVKFVLREYNLVYNWYWRSAPVFEFDA